MAILNQTIQPTSHSVQPMAHRQRIRDNEKEDEFIHTQEADIE